MSLTYLLFLIFNTIIVVTAAENETKNTPNTEVTTHGQQTTSASTRIHVTTNYAIPTSTEDDIFLNLVTTASSKNSFKRDSKDEKKNRQNTTLPCLNWCRYTDNNLNDCWNQSLKYHAHQLKKSVANFYSALLHINRWKAANDDHENKDFEKLIIEDVLDSNFISDNLDVDNSIQDNDEITVNKSTVEQIFHLIFNEYEHRKDHYEEQENDLEPLTLPSLPCPIPCDYYPRIWVAMTIVSSLSMVLLTSIVVFYFMCDAWPPKKGRFRPVFLIN